MPFAALLRAPPFYNANEALWCAERRVRNLILSVALFAAAAPGAAASTGTVEAKPPLVVAVIDSGIARTPELAHVVTAEYDMASDDAREPFKPRYDHGTLVATILLRESRQALNIVSFRIDDPAGCPKGLVPPCQPSAKPLVKAIRKAASLGVDAINISLALRDDKAITAAVREATEQGILVVLAAGNDGRERPGNLDMATAGFPNAVLVGALDDAGLPWTGTNKPGIGSSVYNYAWQRGVAVPSVTAAGAVTRVTGTSFATPAETARLLQCRSKHAVQGATTSCDMSVAVVDPNASITLAAAATAADQVTKPSRSRRSHRVTISSATEARPVARPVQMPIPPQPSPKARPTATARPITQ